MFVIYDKKTGEYLCDGDWCGDYETKPIPLDVTVYNTHEQALSGLDDVFAAWDTARSPIPVEDYEIVEVFARTTYIRDPYSL